MMLPMTTKLETPAKQDFLEEVSEWIEAFDDVIATDWEQGAELLAALKQRAREAEAELAKVDNDVSREVPNALEPLAQLMTLDDSQ